MPSTMPDSSTCPISPDFDPFDADYLRDPYPRFARLRAESPIFYSAELDYWVVSRYPDIQEVLLDSECRFSASEAGAQLTPPCPAAQKILLDADFVPRTNLVDEDPPEHGRRRKILRQGITNARIAELEPEVRRFVTRATSLAGVDLPAGARLLLLTGSANHDEDVFPNPTAFDPARQNANRNLAFGWGRHRCLGENLARMEMRVIYEETARRLPSLRLVEGQDWEYSPNTSFRGPAHLLVTW